MFTFKQLTPLAIALITATALLGCNKNSESPPKDSTANTATPAPSASATVTTVATQHNPNLPTYNVLTDATYPPFESKNADGTVGGMEIELFNAIAKDQGFNANYIPHAWEGIFETLNNSTQKGEVIVSAVGATEEARTKADITDAYYFSPYRITVMDSQKLENWESLPKIGISESEDAVTDLPEKFGIKPEQLVAHKTVFLALQALAQGQVDAVIADATVSQYLLGGETFKPLQSKFHAKNLKAGDGSKLVFAVEKGNPDLVAKINKGLANIKASGEFDKIMTKYNQQPLKEGTVTSASNAQ